MRPLGGLTRSGLVALFAVMLLVPLMLAPMPILGDFPNHAARFWLLGGGMAQMPGMYGADWSRAFTNIGGDLIARALAGSVPGDHVAQGILAFAIIGPPLGCFLLNRRLLGWNVWQLALPALAWTMTLIFGFITFQMGLALALMLAALDAAMRPSALRWAARLAFSAALLVVHPFALLFYAALLGGLTIGPRIADRFASRRAVTGFLGSGLLLVVVCSLPVLVLALTAAHLPGEDQAAGSTGTIWNHGIASRIAALLSPFRTYTMRVDAVFMLLLALVPAYALLRRRLHVHQGLLAVAAILAFVSLFMPTAMAGTSVIELRLPIMALLAAAAAIRIDFARRPVLIGAAVALAALSGLRTADVARHWVRLEADAAAIRTVLAALPPHSAVLPLQHDAPREAMAGAPLGRYFADRMPSFTQSGAFATLWRQSFVPNLFTARGKQPLMVAPAFEQIAVPEGEIASVAALSDPDYPLPQSEAYVRHWRDRFDFALVLNTDMPDRNGPVQLPEGVEVVAQQGFAQLLRLPRARITSQLR
ncbi:hypothetical protein E0493_14520 [Roseomonas sp. M0104]|uniref:YfhO family protein n=1 Tax=Teichococcus coralli TaxID=2545983 RepID=A0A845BAC0_9PROT|nr:hypothetical protein [Pseudoroseomonas coralli]MXP64563.1 hypothetical protein [Pseudoroseomonas coralli]